MSEIKKAAEHILSGKLVAFPTETVYGLGGNALMDSAVASIYEAKGRPQFNPLIVHVANISDASNYVICDETALRLAAHFWPGPLTMVLPRKSNSALSLLLSAGSDTVAMRSPAHPVARALLAEVKVPVAAPSANRSGRISPTEAAHVHEELAGRVAMILDGGACDVGIESTVLDLSSDSPTILRPGSITKEQIEQIIGAIGEGGSTLKSPGMLASHYAPIIPLRMNATSVIPSEALLAFGVPIFGTSVTLNLSESGDLQEAAANLFRMMRILDSSNATSIAVMPIPNIGLGVAINDRLSRAASPRI